jgi:hypothetical protein
MAKPGAKKKKRKGKSYNTFQVKFLKKRTRKKKIKHNYFHAINRVVESNRVSDYGKIELLRKETFLLTYQYYS